MHVNDIWMLGLKKQEQQIGRRNGGKARAEWFDLAEGTQDEIWAWLHKEYLPALCAADGVAWIGHYEIIEQPDQPYIDGAPNKKTIDDPSVPKGWRNVILTAAASPEVYFGPGNPIDVMENAYKVEPGALNYRNAVFIEEQVVNSPEQRSSIRHGSATRDATGKDNCDTPEDEIELAKWYRAERFLRVSVTKGMIRGRKLLSISVAEARCALGSHRSPPGDFNVEARFLEADRDDEWNGRHALEYVTHTFQGPHCGRRVWPEVKWCEKLAET